MEILVNGKTGSRPIPLIDSIPYLKDYLDHEHPQSGNPNAPLICGTGKGLARHINAHRIEAIYCEYKKRIFPDLLESSNTLPEDKPKIRELLKNPTQLKAYSDNCGLKLGEFFISYNIIIKW